MPTHKLGNLVISLWQQVCVISPKTLLVFFLVDLLNISVLIGNFFPNVQCVIFQKQNSLCNEINYEKNYMFPFENEKIKYLYKAFSSLVRLVLRKHNTIIILRLLILLNNYIVYLFYFRRLVKTYIPKKKNDEDDYQ